MDLLVELVLGVALENLILISVVVLSSKKLRFLSEIVMLAAVLLETRQLLPASF